ncbi:MAG: hypothetical protein ACFCVD_23125 [Nodosilinea sp.]
MNTNRLFRQGLTRTLLPLALLGLGALAAQAQTGTCTPLAVVDASSQTEVNKKVSIPGFLVNSSNWNSDFVIPSDSSFNRFVVSIVSRVGTTYDIAVNLKYSDDTVDHAYQENGVTVPLGEPFTIQAAARTGQTPYQVNILVGGTNSVDNEYTASVQGCRD